MLDFYLCLSMLQRTENRRICFGKSRIHGWGLFARINIQEGEMVLELIRDFVAFLICLCTYTGFF